MDDPRAKCIARFMAALARNDEDGMEKLISPAWLAKESISFDSFMVSRLATLNWAPPRYLVEEVRGDTVIVEVPVQSGGSMRLAARVAEERGSYYVIPSGADYCCFSIDPWTDEY